MTPDRPAGLGDAEYTIKVYSPDAPFDSNGRGGPFIGELLRADGRAIARQSVEYPDQDVGRMLAHFASLIAHERARKVRRV